MSRQRPIARVPLFERLTDREPLLPSEPQPQRTLTRPELLRSIQGELVRLLNTRTPQPAQELLGKERSVINYGAGDLGWVSPQNPIAQRELGRILAETIEAFEPRLSSVRVEVERYLPRTQGLELVISGLLVTEDVREPVSFPVAVRGPGGRAPEG
jgi:type VI secretion system protein ImpF